ncbi:MAG: GtrA family protein [Bacteroidetes bacterium]|nr:GtrA family protein [Bacteroidota bacterium]
MQILQSTLLRFLAVGFSNFLVSFTIFHGCLMLPWDVAWKASFSQIISYSAGTVWSFYWNRRLTFRSDGPIVRQGLRFFLLQGSLAVISSVMIGIGVDVLHQHPTVTWVCVMAVITIVNYLLSRFWAFKE